eukprot:9259500-Pyramimonas_sp.AAC.1
MPSLSSASSFALAVDAAVTWACTCFHVGRRPRGGRLRQAPVRVRTTTLHATWQVLRCQVA